MCEVKLLYVSVCAGGVREEAREEEEEAPGIQNQKQEPHTKLWGKINPLKMRKSSCLDTKGAWALNGQAAWERAYELFQNQQGLFMRICI